MRFVSVEELNVGDRIGMNINLYNGRFVMHQGMQLTVRIIEGLKRLQINGVYIDDDQYQDMTVDNHEDKCIRMQSIAVLHIVFDEIMDVGNFKSKPLLHVCDGLVQHLIDKQEFLAQVKDTRTAAGYLQAHSVNVAILSVKTAMSLDYDHKQLRAICVGAILHDLGYAVPGLVHPFYDHPRVGYDIINRHLDIPYDAAQIVLQHHELLNGFGFPNGRKGQEIAEIVQICAVANNFDNYINEIGKNRTMREGIEHIMAKVNSSYELQVVQAFLCNVTPFQMDTHANGQT